MYYNIIVARPFDQMFTYKKADQSLEKGQLVIVPFGKTMEVGMVMEVNVNKPEYIIKNIEAIIHGIKFNEKNIKFFKWVSDYTLAPVGSVLKLFTINKDIISHQSDKKSFVEPIYKSTILNEEQDKAKTDIINIQNIQLVITTIIERSYKIDFFTSTDNSEKDINIEKKCDLVGEKTKVISISEDKLAIICEGRIEVMNLSNNQLEKVVNY